MSPRQAGRTAVLCTLVFGAAIARGQDAPRRPVAVIDLSDTKDGEDLARDLGNVLNNHGELKPLDDLELPAALIGKIKDEQKDRVDEAEALQKTADAALRRSEWTAAARDATNAISKLWLVEPRERAVKLYASLAFILGNAKLGDRKPLEEANAAFRLAHSFDPNFHPNPALTYPEVIDAFDRANAKPPPRGYIAVKGDGKILLDGKEYAQDGKPFGWVATGQTVTITATVGDHVVWLVGPDRDPRAVWVRIDTEDHKSDAVITDAPTPKPTKAQRMRLMLQKAPDPSVHAAAMKSLAVLAEAQDAVLIKSANGQIVVQTWRDRAPGISALRELTRVEADKPVLLLEPLAPAPRKKPPPKQPPRQDKFLPLVVEKPWYERPRYWVAGGSVFLAILVGSIYAYESWDRHIGVDINPSFRGR